MFDTDGSGDISAKELGTVMRMLGENPLRRELSNIIKEAKEDGEEEEIVFVAWGVMNSTLGGWGGDLAFRWRLVGPRSVLVQRISLQV